jgi:NAD(P)-dependent dehydrogenase (short-subunit alcohol dehydrogenase family)
MIPIANLTEQVAVVTGGGRGLGRAIALRLASAGAQVAVVARSAEQLAETAALIQGAGGQSRAFVADVTDPQAVAAMAEAVEQTLGPVTLLVNNAGNLGPAGPLWENDLAAWWNCVEVSLLGAVLCCKVFAPGMVARRQGRIVTMVSEAGRLAIPYASAYVVSKTALIRLTEVLARELAPHSVFAFGVIPGTVRTALTEEAIKLPETQRWLPWFPKIFAEGLDVPPELGAELVLRLASGGADHRTGEVIDVADELADLSDQTPSLLES